MTSKEVLEYLRTCKFCKIVMGTDYENNDRYFTLYDVFSEEIEIIQKDLDRLEKLEKSFKILVDKKVNILVLKYFIEKGDNVEAYNLYYTTKEKLTTEEYELLKEVLEND